jgi:hypothetical protein
MGIEVSFLALNMCFYPYSVEIGRKQGRNREKLGKV